MEPSEVTISASSPLAQPGPASPHGAATPFYRSLRAARSNQRAIASIGSPSFIHAVLGGRAGPSAPSGRRRGGMVAPSPRPIYARSRVGRPLQVARGGTVGSGRGCPRPAASWLACPAVTPRSSEQPAMLSVCRRATSLFREWVK